MRIAVLGPLEVLDDDGAPVEVAGAKVRLLLAALAANAGSVVGTGHLLEALWNGSAPASARKSLQIHVVHLRSALEPSRPRGSAGRFVVRRGEGYCLDVEPDVVDAHRAAGLVRQGRARQAAGDAAGAANLLAEALQLWRGVPFGDWPGAAFAEAERRRLDELRLSATATLLDVRLQLGAAAEVVSEAERLVEEDPLREDSWRLLLLALYRSGRQAHALAAAARARRVLREEVGADPGPALRAVEAAVLAQDPALEPRSPMPAVVPLRTTTVCPYKGLSAYQPADAPFFAGRQQVTRTLVARLVDTPLLVLSGPSGAGKSSVVRAGLLPALADGALPGSSGWDTLVVMPGERPVDALAALTGETPPVRPVVLVCDQFEQLWAPRVDRQERDAFLNAVLGLLDDGVVVRCVAVVRGDAVGRLAEHAGFANRMRSRLVLVPPMTDDELRQVMREPAAAVGLEVDNDLVAAVVADVRRRPGALPLLSTALVGTWQRRPGNRLTLAAYLEAGGVAQALADSAESAWSSLDEAGQEIARRLLVRLADTDDRGALIRRAVPTVELDLSGEGGAMWRAVVEAFVDRRLLALDGERLEVAHEALLSAWPRLARWLEDDAVGRAVRRHLVPAATEWSRRGKPDEDLYRGARLAAALDWAAQSADALTPVERRFLDASRARAEAELEEARERARREAAGRRRTRRLAVGLAAVLVLALVATVLAVRSSTAARNASLVADANRLAALSATAGSLDVSLLLAAQAARLAGTPETEDALLSALLAHPRAMRVVPLPGRVVRGELANGGRSMLLGVGQAVAVWEPGSDELPRTVLTPDPNTWWGWTAMDGAPDRDALVTAGQGIDRPWVRIADTSGHDRLLTDDVTGVPLSLEWIEDGAAIQVLTRPRESAPTTTWELSRIDPGSGEVTPTDVRGLLNAPGDQVEADFSDVPGTAVVWAAQAAVATLVDLGDGTLVPVDWQARDANLVSFRALPSGAAQMWDDGSVQLYARDGRPVQLLTTHSTPVRDVVLATDGTWGATVAEAGDVVIWDVDPQSGRWKQRETLAGHGADVVDADIAPGTTRLFTASVDDTVVEWDLAPGAGFGGRFPPLDGRYVANRPQLAEGLLVAPTRAAGASTDDRMKPDEDTLQVAATFQNPATGRVVDEVPLGETLKGVTFGSSAAVSPDGDWIAVTWGLGVTVLDSRTREVLETIRLPSIGDVDDDGAPLPAEVIWAAGWTPDGSRLLLAAEGLLRVTDDGGLVVVDTSTWDRVGRFPVGALQVMETSPDQSVIVAGLEYDPGLLVLDADSLEVLRSVRLPEDIGNVFDLSFSTDGRLLAAAGDLGGVAVLDTGSWQLRGTPANLHDYGVLQVEWLPDNRTVVSAGADGRVVLFDTQRGTTRARSLPASTEAGEGYSHLVPSINDELTVLSGERPGRQYTLDPARWLTRVCEVVGRDFTRAEWARYLPSRPYGPTCSDLS